MSVKVMRVGMRRRHGGWVDPSWSEGLAVAAMPGSPPCPGSHPAHRLQWRPAQVSVLSHPEC
jgi:hypothetical protein